MKSHLTHRKYHEIREACLTLKHASLDLSLNKQKIIASLSIRADDPSALLSHNQNRSKSFRIHVLLQLLPYM